MTSPRLCGRHVGGHPDGDARGAVDQQVGEGGGKDLGLLLLAVVVGAEVDGLLVDVRDHGHRGLGEAALGVAHRGGRVVAAEGAEVAVAVDEREPHRPRLGQPDQGVVDGGVTMGVQTAHDVADHAGALDVASVGAQAHLVHLVQDAALDRLEAVAGVGEGAGVDDAVGVLKVRAAHLLGHVDVDDVLFELFRRRCGRCAASWWHAGSSYRVLFRLGLLRLGLRLGLRCRCGTGRARRRRR